MMATLSVLIIMAAFSSVQGFGPKTGIPGKKLVTIPLIESYGKKTQFTINFCVGKEKKLYRHPTEKHWYINCAVEFSQPCDLAHNALVLNEYCQECLAEGATKCSKPQASDRILLSKCYNDGCGFCPPSGFGFARHISNLFYCVCSWRRPLCMPCPCEQIFNAKKGCCVPNKALGYPCRKYH